MRSIILCLALTSACGNKYVNGAALAVSTAALAVDWSQTRSMSESGWLGATERNPIMGSTPSVFTVDQYFIGVALVNAIVWAATPRRWRAVVPVGVTAVQARTIVNNSDKTGWF